MRHFKSLFGSKKNKNEQKQEVQCYQSLKKHKKSKKILILGSLCAGKSTLHKQIELNYGTFRDYHLQQYKQYILENILHGTVSFVSVLRKNNKLENADQKFVELCEQFIKMSDEPSFLLDVDQSYTYSTHIKICQLWSRIFQLKDIEPLLRSELEDGVLELIKNVNKINLPNYHASPQDVLWCRTRTTGIVETVIMPFRLYPEATCRIFDVGGARSERKKWIHCMEDVDSILYPVNLMGVCRRCFEDDTQNRMLEELELFEKIVNNPNFANTRIYLILSNIISFYTSYSPHMMQDAFPGYANTSAQSAVRFIKEKFLALVKSPTQAVIVLITDLTNIPTCKQMLYDIFGHEMSENVFTGPRSFEHEYLDGKLTRPLRILKSQNRCMNLCDTIFVFH